MAISSQQFNINYAYALEEKARKMLHVPVRIRHLEQSLVNKGMLAIFQFEDRQWRGFFNPSESYCLVLQEIPKPRCISCGGESLCIIHDLFGRCNNTLSKFWNKVRKLYWHRYIKNKTKCK